MSDTESAIIHSYQMMVNNFSLLVKNKCMIIAELGGKDTLLTGIIAVDHKAGTLILDYGASDFLNKKLVNTPRVKFKTVFNGIQVAFTCDEKASRVTYKGSNAFSMPIPSSLYWYNRRAYYRMVAPAVMNPSSCVIRLQPPTEDSRPAYVEAYKVATNAIRQKMVDKIREDAQTEREEFAKLFAKMSIENKIKAKIARKLFEEELEQNPTIPDENEVNAMWLQLFDISISGFSMLNTNEEFTGFLQAATEYGEDVCSMVLPGQGEVDVPIQIMSNREIERLKTGEMTEQVGVKFLDMKQTAVTFVLRYIQDLERKKSGNLDAL